MGIFLVLEMISGNSQPCLQDITKALGPNIFTLKYSAYGFAFKTIIYRTVVEIDVEISGLRTFLLTKHDSQE